MRYFIITGEPSGDLHARNLIKGLKNRDEQADILFWDSSRMVTVMGFVEVISRLGSIISTMRRCKRELLGFDPDVLIVVDCPGFNLRMASFAHRRGYKVFYYIPPKLWARAEGRIRKIRRCIDEIFIIFPFEVEYFRKLGIEPHYCGNPLVDCIDSHRFEKVGGGGRTIALLAGSRKAELSWMMPRFVELEKLLRADSRFDGYELLVAGAPKMGEYDYSRYIPADSEIKVIFGRTYDMVRQADAAVVCSGTASLETAIIGTPQVVCYGFNRITYLLARMVVHVPYISLANLILGRQIFRELIQDDSTPEEMFKELVALVFQEDYRDKMTCDYEALREALGDGGASERIADKMTELLKKQWI